MLLKIFKKIFYNKECYNCKTLHAKILCINKHISMDPYSEEYNSLKINTLEENIVNYTILLNEMLASLDMDRLVVKQITSKSIKNKNYGLWFTDDQRTIIKDCTKIWLEFTDAAIGLIEWYDRASSSMEDTFNYGLSIKIRPYIINIDSIMDAVIENQVSKDS